MNYIKLYRKKTPRSQRLFARSKKLHVNGVSHNIRYFEPYPFVTTSARGKYLIDADSNKYVDYWMGHWSLILGHNAPQIITHLQKQLKNDWMHGTVNKNAIELSELISKVVPVAQKIRYVTTGTEATMYAVRLARAATGRKIVVKIDGGWHGYTTDLLKAVNWPFSKSESSGLVDEKHIIPIPYNNLDESLEVLNKVKKEIAAIIVEPLLGGGGCIPATREYLKGLDEFTKKNNSIFILDEIVTGFRFRFGCIYDTMGLDPDLVTLGKIVGGGFPIGVICGKNEILNYANTNKFTKTKRAYIGGGTFSANPMTMTAGLVTLNTLKNKNEIYSKIGKLGQRCRTQLSNVFDGKVVTTGMGSLFMTHFVTKKTSQVTNATEAAKCNTALLHKFHFSLIAKHGIFFLPGKLGAISAAHSDKDVDCLIEASSEFSKSI